MYDTIRKVVTFIVLTMFVVPFVLITNIYPAVRFGMFAEPVRQPNQTEQFVLISQDGSGRSRQVQAEDMGLRGDNLSYLLRNHYYQQNIPILLHSALKALPDTKVWILYRLQREAQKVDTTDTKTYFTKSISD